MGWSMIQPSHLLVTGDYITDGIIPHVAHVDPARGIGKHLEEVILLLVGIFRDFERFRSSQCAATSLQSLSPGISDPSKKTSDCVIGQKVNELLDTTTLSIMSH